MGSNMVIENVRQLRTMPTIRVRWNQTASGDIPTTTDEGGCRTGQEMRSDGNMGLGQPGTGSAMVKRND